MTVSAAYRLNPLLDLHWQVLDGQAVVLEATSGETIDLSPLDAAALMCFGEQPCTPDEVVALLRQDAGPVDLGDLAAAVDDLIAQSCAKGWLQADLPGTSPGT